MAFTLHQIAEYLDGMGLQSGRIEDDDKILIVLGDGESKGAVFIKALEDGCVFNLQVEPLDDKKISLDIPKEHKYIKVLLQQLLYYNYNSKFGAWEYDPSDGDLMFAIKFPLEDALMTQKQFGRIWSMAQMAVGKIAEIKEILNTGKLPKKSGDSDMIGSISIEELFADDGEAFFQRQMRLKKLFADDDIFDQVEKELASELAAEKDGI